MKVTVKYSGHLCNLTGKKSETIEMGEGGPLGYLFEMLCGEYINLLPLSEGIIYMVNGKIAKKEQVLAEGDEIHIFQMMAGG